MRTAWLVAGLVWITSCDTPRVQPSAQTPAPHPVAVISDTIRIAELYKQPENDQLDHNRLRFLVDSLEAEYDRADAARRPVLLLAIGRLKILYEPQMRSAHESFAQSRPEEYESNEVGGNYVYTGADFQRLIQTYPTHELADDAAYEMTQLSGRGECEGYTECYVNWLLPRTREFLRGYPKSLLTRLAVNRYLDLFNAALDDVEDLGLPNEYYSPVRVKAALASFDSAAAGLAEPVRSKAQQKSAAIWKRFADAEAASGYTAKPVPDVPPDTLPAQAFAPENRGTAQLKCHSEEYVKDVLAVAFGEIDRDRKQDIVDAMRGNVIGGARGSGGTPEYWIKLHTGKGGRPICDVVSELNDDYRVDYITPAPFNRASVPR